MNAVRETWAKAQRAWFTHVCAHTHMSHVLGAFSRRKLQSKWYTFMCQRQCAVRAQAGGSAPIQRAEIPLLNELNKILTSNIFWRRCLHSSDEWRDIIRNKFEWPTKSIHSARHSRAFFASNHLAASVFIYRRLFFFGGNTMGDNGSAHPRHSGFDILRNFALEIRVCVPTWDYLGARWAIAMGSAATKKTFNANFLAGPSERQASPPPNLHH